MKCSFQHCCGQVLSFGVVGAGLGIGRVAGADSRCCLSSQRAADLPGVGDRVTKSLTSPKLENSLGVCSNLQFIINTKFLKIRSRNEKSHPKRFN